ncbi:MAG: response regulator [Desulfocapsaceae bacterium]|nr:response regulator [Desulfocapsaceae bacterium]
MPNILLVDDEERFVKSLHSILKFHKYECTEALSGTEAMRLLQARSFDVVLLDLQLPDMSGCDILENIKTAGIKTSVIMLTGVSMVQMAVTAMKQGAYDFLNKPIDPDLLVKTIDKAVRHHTLTCELAVSEKRFQILAEAAWEGIVIHEKGMLLEANRQFYAMFGYEAEDLGQGLFLEKILVPASLKRVNRYIENNFFGTCEARGRRKDRTEFPLEANVRFINFQGRPARVCAIRDISERVRAEEEKLALHKKLLKADNLRSLGQMAGSVAHDLNNILSGVVSYPDLLLAQMQESDQFYAKIKKIQDAGKRAAAVVADLVMLARGGSSLTTVENINDIILSHLGSIEHCGRMANYPDVVIETDLQPDLHNTHCSNLHIQKILLNLLGNALEAVQRHGRIRISTQNCRCVNSLAPDPAPHRAGRYIKMSIADDGHGIPLKYAEHIFEPFYTTKIMGKSGTGLGLSIVWNAVRDHNGWIEVRDNEPGALFEIYLPATLEKRSCMEGVGASRLLRGNGEKILLIDDEPEQNEILEKLVTSLGYKTFWVSSGEEGLAFLHSQPVDLILLDMIMGDGLNGRETYERILQIRPGQKVIIISGCSKNEDLLQAQALGVTQFLEKPVTLVKLSQALQRSFSRN